ncbi:MAG: hypothetical protein AAB214_16575, partial [Fibrobacterota bacterium]
MVSFSEFFATRMRRLEIGAALFLLALAGCQDTAPPAQGTQNVSAAMVYSEAWKAPESVTWQAGEGSMKAVARMERSEGMGVAYLPLSVPGSVRVNIATWTLGIRTASFRFRQEGASLKLANDSVLPDPVAYALLAELDKAGIGNRDSLLRRYALHLLDGDSVFRGFPENCPLGIDTASLIKRALVLAVEKRTPLSQLARNWSLDLDTNGLRTRMRELVALGDVPASDTLVAFPRYPVRVSKPVRVPDLEIGRSVAV